MVVGALVAGATVDLEVVDVGGVVVVLVVVDVVEVVEIVEVVVSFSVADVVVVSLVPSVNEDNKSKHTNKVVKTCLIDILCRWGGLGLIVKKFLEGRNQKYHKPTEKCKLTPVAYKISSVRAYKACADRYHN